jgi:transcriptional regulator with XRE-family HTH domain
MATKRRTKRSETTVGQRIAQVRKMRGLSQVELAEKLGIAQPNLSAYERDIYQPGVEFIVRVAKVLEVSADELLGLTKMNKEMPLLTRKLAKRMQKIAGLTRRDQQALLRTIDAFLEKRPA